MKTRGPSFFANSACNPSDMPQPSAARSRRIGLAATLASSCILWSFVAGCHALEEPSGAPVGERSDPLSAEEDSCGGPSKGSRDRLMGITPAGPSSPQHLVTFPGDAPQDVSSVAEVTGVTGA